MAEILLSLTIIGVVAAITLPSLTGNINERTWNTQRKALYARMSQAISLMSNLNGFGSYSGEGTSSAVDTAGETFVTAGLSKVLKINNVCDAEHITDCGLPDSVTPLNGGATIAFPKKLFDLNDVFLYPMGGNPIANPKVAAFETANGESVAVYYNPYCVYKGMDGEYGWDRAMCANFVYDLNGKKGPNTAGKDIGFLTVFYPSDSEIVAPVPGSSDSTTWDEYGDNGVNHHDAIALCRSRGEDYRLPNVYEMDSLFVNLKLLIGDGQTELNGCYWTGTPAQNINPPFNGFHYVCHNEPSNLIERAESNSIFVRCVKR